MSTTKLTIAPKLMILYDADGNEMPALALGETSAEAVAALDAIRKAELTPVGRDPNRVSPVQFKTRPQYIKRADGSVRRFSVSGGLALTIRVEESVEVL